MAADAEERLSGWGRLSTPGRETRGEDLARLSRRANLSRGLGRAYGDAALPADAADAVVGTRFADRLLAFDDETGRLRAEAGISVAALNRIFVPRGWFVPVSPGTEHVTLGGMVAADVHGKNHHNAGSIGRHLTELTVRLASGELVESGPETEPELFWATVGGMGLTGHVLDVGIRLEPIPSSRLRWESWRLGSLGEVVAVLREASAEWPYTAAWIDGLGGRRRRGRGIVLAGRWAARGESAESDLGGESLVTVPFDAPGWILNRVSVGLFNSAYFWRHLSRHRDGVGDPRRFFYPLDLVGDWNRLYGERGPVQHQSVLPAESGTEGVAALLDELHDAGGAPFLLVLKDFGAEGRGLLSFPRPGLTLAVDLPMGPETQTIVDRLNEFVIGAGGRIYLAKDALTRRRHFEAMEGDRLERFRAARRRFDPDRAIRSRLSERLGL